MERRSLHRPAPGARRDLRESEDYGREPGDRGSGPDCAGVVRNPAAPVYGRQVALPRTQEGSGTRGGCMKSQSRVGLLACPFAAKVSPRKGRPGGLPYTILLLALIATGCGHQTTRAAGKKMIVLGVDGMDPQFLEAHWSS